MRDELAKQVVSVLRGDSRDLERATELTQMAEEALCGYIDAQSWTLADDVQAITAIAHIASARALLAIKADIG